MEPGDDDERANAYDRYINNEFVNIVHNYDDTASVDHDNINYFYSTFDELDGAEFDDHGEPVKRYGLVFFFIRASEPDDDWNPDDDDPQARADRFFDAWAEVHDDLHDLPPDNFFRFPLYNPRRGACKRRRGDNNGSAG